MPSDTDYKKHLSRLRHDLRTPLNAIIGYSEMILDDIEDSSQDSSKSDTPEMIDFIKNLKKIHITGSNMVTQINEILNPEKTLDFIIIAAQLHHEFQPYSDIIAQCCKRLIQSVKNIDVNNIDTKNIFEEDFIDDIEKIYVSN